jgi:hypothetical protein
MTGRGAAPDSTGPDWTAPDPMVPDRVGGAQRGPDHPSPLARAEPEPESDARAARAARTSSGRTALAHACAADTRSLLGVARAAAGHRALRLRGATNLPQPPDPPATAPATPANAMRTRWCTHASAGRDVYFLFLRWMRVFFSSLRCFFFAMRLRRFLMTEPMRPPLSWAFADDGYANTLARYGRLNTQVTRDAAHVRAQLGKPRPGRPAPTPRYKGNPQVSACRKPAAVSGGADVGSPQVLVDCLFRYPEGATDPDRFQLTGVDQSVHGHLRHAHDQGHFGNGKEPYVA